VVFHSPHFTTRLQADFMKLLRQFIAGWGWVSSKGVYTPLGDGTGSLMHAFYDLPLGDFPSEVFIFDHEHGHARAEINWKISAKLIVC
jgi:hypothetical protein